MRSLRFFRFVRAVGGHANDGDQLLAAFRWTDEAELAEILGHLGAGPPAAPVDPSGERAGPGWITLAGVEVYARVAEGRVILTLSGASGDPYRVTDADVAGARRVEAVLAPLADRLIDPPIEGERCVSPARYPELWDEGTSGG